MPRGSAWPSNRRTSLLGAQSHRIRIRLHLRALPCSVALLNHMRSSTRKVVLGRVVRLHKAGYDLLSPKTIVLKTLGITCAGTDLTQSHKSLNCPYNLYITVHMLGAVTMLSTAFSSDFTVSIPTTAASSPRCSFAAINFKIVLCLSRC